MRRESREEIPSEASHTSSPALMTPMSCFLDGTIHLIVACTHVLPVSHAPTPCDGEYGKTAALANFNGRTWPQAAFQA
jgi:hypothetical protein